MTKRVTIHLNGPYAPGGKDWIQGNVTSETSHGITIEPTMSYRADPMFFPWQRVERVDIRP